MPSYSSQQFSEDWRYAIDKDFTTPDGSPFPCADNGKKQWGDEIKKITFDGELHDGCISNDSKHLAVAVEHDIHVLDTRTWETISVLKGHTSRVSALAFKPGDSNTLVSSEQHDYGRSDPNAQPTIIVWKLDQAKGTHALESESLGGVSRAAAVTAADRLAHNGVNLAEDLLLELENAFKPDIARVVTRHMVRDNIRIYGRLQTSFQSEIFSPSGNQMIYMPGERPRSNDCAPWDLNICSTDDFTCQLTLKGHTDAIMWTGWSPDESHIASIAWDGTVRIWDAATGRQTHRFDTNHQNWTGAFSPDSSYFVATDGKGNVRVYALRSESTYWEYLAEEGTRWRRAVACHPNGKLIAVGGGNCGEILLLDIEKRELLQKRTLSLEAAQPDREDVRRHLRTNLAVTEVKFVDHGNKLATWTSGDCSIEIYDLSQQVKWRFARGGTEDGPQADEWRNENGKVISKRGHGMLIWEDPTKGILMLVSIDFDGIRVWAVELTGASKFE